MRALLALVVLSLLAGCGNQAAAGTVDSKAAPAASGCDCCADKTAGKEGDACCADKKEGEACCSEKTAAKEGEPCCAEKPAEPTKKP